jgi:NADH:ubiquinone oxidoreductase subunit C
LTKEELKIKIEDILPAATFDETGEWLNILIEAKAWYGFAKQIRSSRELEFDYLFCLTCIDWKTHLTMVYHFTSTYRRHTIVIKSKLDRNNPEIESVAAIWRTAEFHEREVYELFGVKFLNHPDMRKLLLTDDWSGGFPLRKDFEDPINMIRL